MKRFFRTEHPAESAVTRPLKQILALAAVLLVFCVVSRLTFERTYTVQIPYSQTEAPESGPTFLEEMNGIVSYGTPRIRDGFLTIPVQGLQQGTTSVEMLDRSGEVYRMESYRVGPLHTVYHMNTGGFTGEKSFLIAVTAFWFLAGLIAIRAFLLNRGPAFYAYSTVYYLGFSVFSLITGAVMLYVTLRHLLHPGSYPMMLAYEAISGAGMMVILYTMPLYTLFAAALAVSNLALLRHEKPRPQNFISLIFSVLMILGDYLALRSYFSDFIGSEWEYRLRCLLQNICATAWVYFECMLLGTALCGWKAARHVPAPDCDFIIVLGCYFRRDGSLPPLLRGRADKALEFWQYQKDHAGKAARIIPSGGQGKDESMPEAQAISRYLLSRGVPGELILPEENSANTYENMAFSRQLIGKEMPEAKVVYATTGYHVFRSGVWASKAGLRAEGIGSRTRWWYWPNAFMRECVSLYRSRLLKEILLIAAMTVFYALLSVLLW